MDPARLSKRSRLSRKLFKRNKNYGWTAAHRKTGVPRRLPVEEMARVRNAERLSEDTDMAAQAFVEAKFKGPTPTTTLESMRFSKEKLIELATFLYLRNVWFTPAGAGASTEINFNKPAGVNNRFKLIMNGMLEYKNENREDVLKMGITNENDIKILGFFIHENPAVFHRADYMRYVACYLTPASARRLLERQKVSSHLSAYAYYEDEIYNVVMKSIEKIKSDTDLKDATALYQLTKDILHQGAWYGPIKYQRKIDPPNEPRDPAIMKLVEKTRIDEPDATTFYNALKYNDLLHNRERLRWATVGMKAANARRVLYHFAPSELPLFNSIKHEMNVEAARKLREKTRHDAFHSKHFVPAMTNEDYRRFHRVDTRDFKAKYHQFIARVASEKRITPKYSENAKNPLVMVHAHGSYLVTAENLPRHQFTTPIKVILYRVVHPSVACFYDTTGGEDYRFFKQLKLLHARPEQKQIVQVLNRGMCPFTVNNDDADIYIDHCLEKIASRVYEKGASMALKQYSFNVPRDAVSGARVICDHDFFSDETLLLPISNTNRFTMEDVVRAAASHGAEECHLVDFTCSSFERDGKYLVPNFDYIELWDKMQLGGAPRFTLKKRPRR